MDASIDSLMSLGLRQPRHRFTYAEYLAYERDSGMKHEYATAPFWRWPGVRGGTMR